MACCLVCEELLDGPPYTVIHGERMCAACAPIAEEVLGCLSAGPTTSTHWEVSPARPATLAEIRRRRYGGPARPTRTPPRFSAGPAPTADGRPAGSA